FVTNSAINWICNSSNSRIRGTHGASISGPQFFTTTRAARHTRNFSGLQWASDGGLIGHVPIEAYEISVGRFSQQLVSGNTELEKNEGPFIPYRSASSGINLCSIADHVGRGRALSQ